MTKNDEECQADEIARRRDDAIRRALNTPPTPLKNRPKKARGTKSPTSESVQAKPETS